MRSFIIALLVLAPQAWAIKYYQNTSGSLKVIEAAAFEACTKIYYRNVAKSELTPEHQKNLLKASLKGELVNDSSAVSSKLKSTEGSCTYSENNENL